MPMFRHDRSRVVFLSELPLLPTPISCWPSGDTAIGLDAADYKGRNVIERRYCHIKQWRGLATRYDKLAITYRPLSSSTPSSPGPGNCQTCPSCTGVCGCA